MRLVTFKANEGKTNEGEAGDGQRLGAVVAGQVVDLARLAQTGAGATLPSSMLDLIAAGPDTWNRARDLIADHAARLDRLPGGVVFPMSGVTLMAPIPRPTKNVFCLGINYSAHLEESNRAAT